QLRRASKSYHVAASGFWRMAGGGPTPYSLPATRWLGGGYGFGGGFVVVPSFATVAAGWVGGGAACSAFTRVSMPFSCRLRISQRSSFDSLMPIRMSLIDSYTDGSLTSFPAVP